MMGKLESKTKLVNGASAEYNNANADGASAEHDGGKNMILTLANPIYDSVFI